MIKIPLTKFETYFKRSRNITQIDIFVESFYKFSLEKKSLTCSRQFCHKSTCKSSFIKVCIQNILLKITRQQVQHSKKQLIVLLKCCYSQFEIVRTALIFLINGNLISRDNLGIQQNSSLFYVSIFYMKDQHRPVN